MPQIERHGARRLDYSAWHRIESIRRFVGIEKAQTLNMIDIDVMLYVEADKESRQPLAFIEVAEYVGNEFKPSSITKNIAMRMSPPVRAYVALYTLSESRNPADKRWFDISEFRVKRLWPEPETGFVKMTPAEWANTLVTIRNWSSSQFDKASRISANG